MQKCKENILADYWVCVNLLNLKMIWHKNTDIDEFSGNYTSRATEFGIYFHSSI